MLYKIYHNGKWFDAVIEKNKRCKSFWPRV